MVFGERLNLTRKSRGLTAQFVADQIGITLRAYQYYESGKREPNLSVLVAISDLLDVSVDYLLGRDEFLSKHADEH